MLTANDALPELVEYEICWPSWRLGPLLTTYQVRESRHQVGLIRSELSGIAVVVSMEQCRFHPQVE